MKTNNLGIYIHIPFCERKCSYCGFLSFPLRNDLLEKYIDYLCKEIEYMAEIYGNRYIVDTVFIGGGTPSLLKPNHIKRIMNELKSGFEIDKNAEISIESNPNSLDLHKLDTYLKSGINRLSMGIQSFDNDVLKKIGRIHDVKTAIDAYKMARNAGFDNINIDLMFALPDQNKEIWQETLKIAFSLEPEHISFYSLQIEENTEFYNRYKNDNLNVPSDKIADEMYQMALNMIKANNYNHYEISNCSKNGYNCRHNIKYWQLDDYLAFGIGASGYIDGYRYKNPDDMKAWELEVKNKTSIDKKEESVIEPMEDAIAVFCFTALRTKNGIDFAKFQKRFGKSFFDIYNDKREFIEKEVLNGHMILTENNLKLTENGILISNDLMCEFV